MRVTEKPAEIPDDIQGMMELFQHSNQVTRQAVLLKMQGMGQMALPAMEMLEHEILENHWYGWTDEILKTLSMMGPATAPFFGEILSDPKEQVLQPQAMKYLPLLGEGAKPALEAFSASFRPKYKLPFQYLEFMEKFGKTGVPVVAKLMDRTPMEDWAPFLPYFQEMGLDAAEAFPMIRNHYFQTSIKNAPMDDNTPRNLLNRMIMNLGEPGLDFLATQLDSRDLLVTKDQLFKFGCVAPGEKVDDEMMRRYDWALRRDLSTALMSVGTENAAFTPAPTNKDNYVWGDGDWKPMPPFIQILYNSSNPASRDAAKGILVGGWRKGDYYPPKLGAVRGKGPTPTPTPELTAADIQKRKAELRKIWKTLATDAEGEEEGCDSCYDLVRLWPTSKPLIQEALKRTDGNYRMNALNALSQLGPKASDLAPDLHPLMIGGSLGDMVNAAALLCRMGSAAVSYLPDMDVLLGLLERPEQSQPLLQEVSNLGPAAIPLMVKYGEIYENRRTICWGFCRSATTEWTAAVPYLQEMTQERRLEIRKTAWQALESIRYRKPRAETGD